MEFLSDTKFWLITGGVLILLEFLLPGLVVVFLGMAALTTALAIANGWATSIYSVSLTFVISSLFYLVFLRHLVTRFLPAETKKVETDEDKLLLGKEVTVLTTVNTANSEGRVKYSGTTWPARSEDTILYPGDKGIITGRENIALLIKKN